jgi:hypothetical protein
VGTSEGFVGCIYKLKVGRRPIEFDEKDPLINSFQKISQCPIPSPVPRLTTTPLYVPIDEEEEEEVMEQQHNHNSNNNGKQHEGNSVNRHGKGNEGGRKSHHKSDEAESRRPVVGSDSNNNVIGINPDEMSGTGRNSCAKNPCQNNGICWNDRGNSKGFKCVCHPEFHGKKKERVDSIYIYIYVVCIQFMLCIQFEGEVISGV